MSRYAVVALFMVLVAGSARAQGGPPLITDDPGTPGQRNWEINVGAVIVQEGDGTIYQAPDLD